MALVFDGSTGYLESSTLPIPTSTYPITVLGWAKVANVTASHTLFALDNAASNRRLLVQADGAFAGDPIVAYAFDTAGNQGVSASGFTANTWFQFIALFTANNSRTAGINNVLGTAETTARSATWNRCKVGARYNSGIGAYCNGSIANLGVWNVTLTTDEIAAHYQGVACHLIRPSALKLYVKGHRDARDESMSAVPWTVNGTVTAGDHIRTYG